jgi:serine/threonine-protein kinase
MYRRMETRESQDRGARTWVGAPDPGHGAEGNGAFIGRTLGGLYRLTAVLGEGAMGTVYAAEHRHLGARFALKVLKDGARSAEASARLLAEARAASRIDHPNVVRVVNCDHDGDRVFVVMERLVGRTLEARHEEGPLDNADAVEVARQVARGLGAAHALGLLHRAVKPSNVFLVGDAPRSQLALEANAVKLLDFGVAKALEPEAGAPGVTQEGALVGTPLYLSPEQARGEEALGPAVDQYALGAVLFEMLTGRPPFEGPNVWKLVHQHASASPPRPTRPSGEPLPEALEQVVLRLLAKAPEARFASLAEVDAALASSITEPPTSATPSRASGRRRRSALGLVLLASLGLAATATWLASREASPEDARREPEALKAEAVYPPPVESLVATRSEPPPPPAPAVVRLELVSDPPGAEAFIDGRSVGVAPVVITRPASGEEVTVRFSLRETRRATRPERRDVTRQVKLEGERQRVEAALPLLGHPRRALPIKTRF